jgi:hypothetical protein
MPFEPNMVMLIPILGIVFGTSAMVILAYPFIRAWAKRVEQRDAPPPMSEHVDQRLARIEAAVESIAIEVERISESQRFLTKLQAGQSVSAGSNVERTR